MTQDEIIEMARQAGCPDVYTEWAKFDWSSIKGLIVPMTLEQLVHCAKLVAAKEQKKWQDQTVVEIHEAILEEREACAKVCESIFLWSYDDPGETAANAIRARGEA